MKLEPQQEIQSCDCHDHTTVLEEWVKQGTLICGMTHWDGSLYPMASLQPVFLPYQNLKSWLFFFVFLYSHCQISFCLFYR